MDKIQWDTFKDNESGQIPERATITFYLDNESTIDVRLRDNKLVITASDRLEIQPRSSNQIWIGALLNPPA